VKHPASNQPTWRILVVDDEPLISGIVARALKSLGHTVFIAEDGTTALHMVHADSPDAILLDVNMPGRDGFEVLKILKEDPATCDIAVLMVTAQRSEGYIVAGLREADDYVCKPFGMGELVARLNAVMRRVGSHSRARYA
jgi:DNA-binding response OmpR family regulator